MYLDRVGELFLYGFDRYLPRGWTKLFTGDLAK